MRSAVAAGTAMQVWDDAVPASGLARIYARRLRLTRRNGTSETGFAEAVRALRAYGEERVRIEAVTAADFTTPTSDHEAGRCADLPRLAAVIGSKLVAFRDGEPGVEPRTAHTRPTSSRRRRELHWTPGAPVLTDAWIVSSRASARRRGP
jgi:hypothetical protein